MEEKMIEKINKEIRKLEVKFQETKKFDAEKNAYIDGMIDMLVIVTGKEYFIDTKNVCLTER